MKTHNTSLKKLLLGSFAVCFIVGCGTSGPKQSRLLKKNRTDRVSDIGKKELAGDLKERLARSRYYTQNNSLLSVLSKDKVKEKCRFDAKKDFEDWGNMLRVGFVCVNEKKWDTVRLIGETFSVRHIDAPWGAYFLSLVSEKEGNMPRALWMIGLADRKSPENGIIEFQKARLLWLQDQKDAAFQSAKKALELEPKLAEAALLMAQVYFSDYEFENAQTYYRKVIDANDEVFGAVLGMADSFAQLDKFKEAVPFYIRAIKLKKNRIDLAYVLADIYETKIKDYKRALTWYEKISGVFPKEVVSKERTEILNKIATLNTKIEEQTNPVKTQQAKKQQNKRVPASTNQSNEKQVEKNSNTDSEEGGQ